MAKINEDGRKADFGVGPSWLFSFSFTSGLGGAASAEARAGLSPAFLFA